MIDAILHARERLQSDPDVRLGARAVLLAMCSYTDKDTALTRVSAQTIAAVLGMGERAVRRSQQQLEQAGYIIAWQRREGRSTIWRLPVPSSTTPDPGSGVGSPQPRSLDPAPRTVGPGTPDRGTGDQKRISKRSTPPPSLWCSSDCPSCHGEHHVRRPDGRFERCPLGSRAAS